MVERLPASAARPGRRQGPAGAGRRLTRRAGHLLVQAVGRSVRRHQARQRPPCGEDVRADAGARDADAGRLRRRQPDAIFRGRAEALRPSRAARRRGGGQRRGLRAVQRSDHHEEAGRGRRSSPGTRTARPIGTARTGTRTSMASTSWPSSMDRPRPMPSGTCRAATCRRQGRPRGAGRRGGQRAAAAGGADDHPAGRCLRSAIARSIHGSFANTSARLAGDLQHRLPPPPLGARRRRATSTIHEPIRSTTTSASASARR